VCGITDAADALAAIAAGADLLGFIFFPKSPRYVLPERVRDILDVVEPGRAGLLSVGVFVDEPIQAVTQILDFCGLDLAQLHGDEPPAMLGLEGQAQGGQAPGRAPTLAGRAYKALRPRSAEEAADLAARYALPAHLRAGGRLPALLVDAYHPHLRGGTGETADWQLAAGLARQYALLLAGGLTPANVAQAVKAVRPWGVDVSSGVEASPGHKDHAALHAFIDTVRNTHAKRAIRNR
jgi:phosphoribosylanthranilate isomerase